MQTTLPAILDFSLLSKTQLMQCMRTSLEKVRLSAFVDTCRFQTIQSLDFQEIWQKDQRHRYEGRIVFILTI